jgi:hypothetical protein
VLVDDDTASPALLSGASWNTVALGPRLLQAAPSALDGASRIGQMVFATAPCSSGDAGLWGLARTFRIEQAELRLRGIECAAGKLAVRADATYIVAHADAPMRFNDGRCDRQGRFWAGTMHLD